MTQITANEYWITYLNETCPKINDNTEDNVVEYWYLW